MLYLLLTCFEMGQQKLLTPKPLDEINKDIISDADLKRLLVQVRTCVTGTKLLDYWYKSTNTNT
jgi:hypothetical protein